jgi:hypothetical protein
MPVAPRLTASLILAAAMGCGGAAGAAEPGAIATAPPAGSGAPPNAAPASSAPASSAPGSVADQIDAYLKTSPALALPRDAASGVTAGQDGLRKPHGMVDVAVGSNGYRSAFVQSDLPVGKTGTVSIAVGETRFKARGLYDLRGYGGPGDVDRRSVALGLSMGETALDPHDPRCRQMADEGFDARFGGVRPSACLAPQATRTAQ